MMKYLLMTLIIFTAVICSAVTGAKTIGVDYDKISTALVDLNTTGVTGNVIINIPAGYTETITAPLSCTATGSAGNTLTFRKDPATTGANPLVTAYINGTGTPSTAVQDGIWNFVGSDYVTIDGINLYDPNSTQPATMEYGYGFFKASATDGCQYNVIRNCVVTLSRNNWAAATAPAVEGSRAIQFMNALVTAQTSIVTVTTTTGANSYNQIYGNTVQNCNYGIVLIGYAGTSPFTTCDTSNDIGGSASSTGNNIINFGGGSLATVAAAGIRTLSQYGINVSYNTVNNNTGSGINHPYTLRGIYLNTATSAGATISYNTITITGGGTASVVYAIDNQSGSTAASNTININHNVITGSYTTATSGIFYVINNAGTPATLNANYNTISNITTSGAGNIYAMALGGGTSSIAFTANNNNINTIGKTGSGSIIGILFGTCTAVARYNTIDGFTSNSGSSMDGIYTNAASVLENFSDNLIRNFTTTGAGTAIGIYISSAMGNKTIQNNAIYNFTVAGTGNLYGIRKGYGSTDVISNNIVHDLSVTGASSGSVYGIYSNAGTTNSIYSNQVYTLSNAGGTSGSIYGIYLSFSSSTNGIYKNKIYDLSSGASNPTVYGLYVSNGTTHNVYNNLIGDLRTPAANAILPLVGIYVGGGTNANIYYNTVNLNASSNGALFGSTALYVSAAVILTLRNTILINISTSNGAGITAALRRSASALTNYNTVSNNNLFYAGTTGPGNVVYYNGTSGYGYTAFKTLVGPVCESASVSEPVTFLSNTGSSANFLHIDPTLPTSVESRAAEIANYPDDYDGDARATSPNFPDIGADEVTTPGIIPAAPLISEISIDNNNVHITWDAVTQSSTGQPLTVDYYLIYKSNDGITFDFLNYIMSGVTSFNETNVSARQCGFYKVIAFKGTLSQLTAFIESH